MDEKTAKLTETIRTEAQRHANIARGNKDFSVEKRNKVIARAYLDEKRRLEQAQADSSRAAAQRRATLERKIFGLPDRADASAMISYRDALDRASKLSETTGGERAALALLNRAQTSGDTLLAKAILATAYENQWVDVINTHIADNPAIDTDANELWDISTGRDSSLIDQFSFVASKPAELRNFADATLQNMAADEPPTERVSGVSDGVDW